MIKKKKRQSQVAEMRQLSSVWLKKLAERSLILQHRDAWLWKKTLLNVQSIPSSVGWFFVSPESQPLVNRCCNHVIFFYCFLCPWWDPISWSLQISPSPDYGVCQPITAPRPCLTACLKDQNFTSSLFFTAASLFSLRRSPKKELQQHHSNTAPTEAHLSTRPPRAIFR